MIWREWMNFYAWIHMSNFHPIKLKWLAVAICHVKYWSVTEIVTCISLTSNQMIFLVQIGINKNSQTFQRLQIALILRARAIFCSLWKIYSCLFIPNCTRNHLITYTNLVVFQIYKSTNLQIYKSTNLQIYKSTNLQIYKSTNLQKLKNLFTKTQWRAPPPRVLWWATHYLKQISRILLVY